MSGKDTKQADVEDDEFVGYAGARDATGLPYGTLYCKVARKQIPHVRLGKRLVRFSKKALAEYMAVHSVPEKTP